MERYEAGVGRIIEAAKRIREEAGVEPGPALTVAHELFTTYLVTEMPDDPPQVTAPPVVCEGEPVEPEEPEDVDPYTDPDGWKDGRWKNEQ